MSVGISIERDHWLAERRHGIGAPDAPSIVGIRSRPTRLEIWMDKRGELASSEPTEAMRWGLRLEGLIAEAYQERTGNIIGATQSCAWHRHHKWMRATLDAITADGRVLEFKACGSWAGRKLPDDGDAEGLPEAWVIQGQHQMCVAGVDKMTFCVFVDMGLRLYELARNDDLINDLITLEREFWGLVESGTPPAEFQPEDAAVLTKHFKGETGETIELDPGELTVAINRFVYANGCIKQHERDRDEYKAELLMAMGNASTATCGPYTLRRKLVNVKERTQVIKASSHIRFSITNGDTNDE